MSQVSLSRNGTRRLRVARKIESALQITPLLRDAHRDMNASESQCFGMCQVDPSVEFNVK